MWGVVLSFVQLFGVYPIEEIFIETQYVLHPDTKVRFTR